MCNTMVAAGKPAMVRGRQRLALALGTLIFAFGAASCVVSPRKTKDFPGASNRRGERSYAFTRTYNAKRAKNPLSGLNLSGALKGLKNGPWGLSLNDYDYDAIRDAGFSRLRISVDFLSRLGKEDGAYRLDGDLLAALDDVIGNVLNRGMIAIIDFHNLIPEGVFAFESEAAAARNEEEFLAVWAILSDRYRAYPQSLYFELANEPRDPLTPAVWNRYVRRGLATIRRSGGANATRTVIVSTGILIRDGGRTWDYTGGIGSLELPPVSEDTDIIVTFHCYTPEAFTFQGDPVHDGLERTSWMRRGKAWAGTESQKAAVRARFDAMDSWARSSGRRVMLGEFGVSTGADMESLVAWTKFVREEAESRGMPWHLWQAFDPNPFGGVYNPLMGFWREEILEALIPKAAWSPIGIGNDGRPCAWNAGDEARIKILSASLDDPEMVVRRSAARALMTSRPEAELAVPALAKALRDDEWMVRKAAASALSVIVPASRAAVPELTAALSDEEWQVRIEAVRALGALGSAALPALPALIDAAGDGEWGIRKSVVYALSAVAPRHPEALEAIRALLEDPEDQVRHAAALWLRSSEGRAAD